MPHDEAPDNNDQLFFSALTTAHNTAMTHGISNNYSVLIEQNVQNGFMQQVSPDTTRIINTRINAFVNDNERTTPVVVVNTNAVALSNLGKQFSVPQLNGLVLANLAECTAFSVINPFSNPKYAGANLAANLTSISIDKVPFIFVPLLDYCVYDELIKKYYGAAILLYAGSKTFAFDDVNTPGNLRVRRKTQILYLALVEYCRLAAEVAELFEPEAREIIKRKLIFLTAYPYVLEFSSNLLELSADWQKNCITDNLLAEMDAFIRNAFALIQDICNNVVEYVDKINTNPTWQYETFFPSSNCQNNTPLTSDDKNQREIISNCKRTLILLQKNFCLVKMHFNMLSKSAKFDADCLIISDSFQIPILINGLLLGNLAAQLSFASTNFEIRASILQQINDNVIFNGTSFKKYTLLNDAQLVAIFTHMSSFILDNVALFHKLNFDGNQSDHFIQRTSPKGIKDPAFIRSLIIRRLQSGFRLVVVCNRKDSSDQHVLPKFRGSTSKVSIECDITPVKEIWTRIAASKSIGIQNMKLTNRNFSAEFERFKTGLGFSKEMGLCLNVSQPYQHKKRREGIQDFDRVSIRVHEKWNPVTLASFINTPNLYELDQEYFEAVNNDHHKAQNVLSKIKRRLVYEITKQLEKLHDKIDSIHRDIKIDNILIETERNELHAILTDFSLGIKKSEASKHLPLGTAAFAAPECAWLQDKQQSLIGAVSLIPGMFQKEGSLYVWPSFGRELYQSKAASLIHDKSYQTMQAQTSNDLFSLGIVISMVYGYYPTNLSTSDSLPFYNTVYTSVANIIAAHPELDYLSNLLAFNPADRMTAAQLIKRLETIDPSLATDNKRPRLGGA